MRRSAGKRLSPAACRPSRSSTFRRQSSPEGLASRDRSLPRQVIGGEPIDQSPEKPVALLYFADGEKFVGFVCLRDRARSADHRDDAAAGAEGAGFGAIGNLAVIVAPEQVLHES